MKQNLPALGSESIRLQALVAAPSVAALLLYIDPLRVVSIV